MDLNRLSLDLAAALEGAREHAARDGIAYIQPRHLLLALLEPQGALERVAASLGLDARMALGRVLRSQPDTPPIRLEPGRHPLAGRALRDLLDRAAALADRRDAHTVGPLEVALAAAQPSAGELARALTDAGWTPERLGASLDSPEVLQPARAGEPETTLSPLARFTRDLTRDAREGRLAPVVGRAEEMRQVMQTLLRRAKNNPVLVGDPGTGKTAIAEGLAQRIAAGDVPESLRGVRLLALDLAAVVAGAKYRGEFEERLRALVEEVREAKDVVLFLDELQALIGAGSGAGGVDAANLLKPALARGELRCIGATTHDAWREQIESDGALARRFEKVVVAEPADEEVLAMLDGAVAHYEAHHGVAIPPEARSAAVKLARRHLRDRAFPDKAFDVLDEAAARLRLERESAEGAPAATELAVRAEDVAEVVARRARVPVARMLEGDRERLLRLEERLRERVFGQDDAVATVADAARRMRADLRQKRKPASYLFVGPTGVGKTELAKGLAEALFDDDTALIRIDMAEYKESHSVSGLIGSRPGLVGSEKGGFLTEQVRRSPHAVVLFDEVEKAHPEVIDLLLGVLDEGRLTDAQGRLCDFTNTLIVLTSNLGVREAQQAGADAGLQREILLKVVQASLRPELFNRLSGVIAFNALEMPVLEQIVRKHLGAVGQQLAEQYGGALEADAEAVALLAALAYDPAYGARPVERTLERYVVSDLSRLAIAGEVRPGSLVRVVRDGDGVTLLAGPPGEVAAAALEIRLARAGPAPEAEAAPAELATVEAV